MGKIWLHLREERFENLPVTFLCPGYQVNPTVVTIIVYTIPTNKPHRHVEVAGQFFNQERFMNISETILWPRYKV